MPEENETETEQVEQQSQEPETAPETDATADPWSDPAAARKEIEKLRREAAGHRTKVRELEPLAAKARELEDAQKSVEERLTEQLAAERERALAATRTAVGAKVEALAAKSFADPEDAAGALDLSAYVDESGAIDATRIQADLAALLERKPHWARPDTGTRSPRPDHTQGSSGNGNRTPNDPSAAFEAWFKQARTGL
jgi:cytoskeletal protein RodZ